MGCLLISAGEGGGRLTHSAPPTHSGPLGGIVIPGTAPAGDSRPAPHLHPAQGCSGGRTGPATPCLYDEKGARRWHGMGGTLLISPPCCFMHAPKGQEMPTVCRALCQKGTRPSASWGDTETAAQQSIRPG